MAVKIMYEDEIAAAGDKLAYIKEKKAEYTDALSGAVSAARRGYVDDIIEPDATRKRVIAALDMLFLRVRTDHSRSMEQYKGVTT